MPFHACQDLIQKKFVMYCLGRFATKILLLRLYLSTFPRSMTASQLLKQYDLRNTQSRLEVLQAFEGERKALSQADIEAHLVSQFDRVTVYRTLRTFLGKGILHKVLDDEGTPKYALCGSACADDHHQHEHVHFKCHRCGKTTCVEHVEIPPVHLPGLYTVQEQNLLLQGICPTCNALTR